MIKDKSYQQLYKVSKQTPQSSTDSAVLCHTVPLTSDLLYLTSMSAASIVGSPGGLQDSHRQSTGVF
jgi:hypothetical protein